MDASNLGRFCTRHFGRTVPYVEGAPPSMPPAGLTLPYLFTLDAHIGCRAGSATA